MKNILSVWSLIILSFLLFFSCNKPPENAKEINYLDLINSNIGLLNEIKINKSSLNDDINNIFARYKDMIVAFYKNSEIILDSIEAEHNDDTVVYSINNNKFIVNKSFYITLLNKKPVFSLDNKTWYYVKNDINKGIQGIYYDYLVTSEKVGNKLTIRYKAALSLGKNPAIAYLKNKREIITLKKGMIINSRIKEIKKIKLTDKILFISKGTTLSGYHIIKGDFIKSSYQDGKIIIEAMQNIYFYVKNIYSFYVSLDKKNWGLNIISFETKPAIEIFVKEDNEYFFNFSTTINYYKDKVSIMPSLLKLLLRNK